MLPKGKYPTEKLYSLIEHTLVIMYKNNISLKEIVRERFRTFRFRDCFKPTNNV